MDSKQKYEIPEFDFKTDYVLVKIIFVVLFTPLFYGVFNSYLPSVMAIPWMFVSVLMSLGLLALGRWATRTVAKERVEYDPEKTRRQYIILKKTWLGFLIAAAVAVVFFFIAYGMKLWFWNVFDDKTTPHSKGYVYETVAAGYAFFVTYFASVTWFLHDGMVIPAGYSLSFDLVIPIAMLIVPITFGNVPTYVAVVYTVIMVGLIVARNLRVRSYNKIVEKLERENKYIEHNSKSRFD
jgi:hypothetical protein